MRDLCIRVAVVAVLQWPVAAGADLICTAGCDLNPPLRVGYLAQGDGSLTIDTATVIANGSVVNTSVALIGGGTSTASVTIDGGALNTGGIPSLPGYALIGTYGGAADVDIRNGGSFSVNLGNDLAVIAHVGFGGTATVDVATGGQLAVTGDTVSAFLKIGISGESLGYPAAVGAADGAVNVSGASSLLSVTGNGAFIDLGASVGAAGAANGLLQVTNGGTVTIEGGSSFGYFGLGRGGAGDGRVVISGAGSAINVSGSPALVFVSSDIVDSVTNVAPVGAGTGVLSISDDGQLNVTSSTPGNAGTVIGYGRGSGLATVDSGGQLNAGDALVVSGNDLDTGNDAQTGTLIVNGTGRASATNIFVGNGGGVDGSPAVGINGILAGTGTVVGDVTVLDGGLLSPGNSPGTFTIVGDLTIDSGLLEIELGGTGLGEFDRLLVSGTADLSNANILFSFIDGYLPDAGDFIDFLVADAIQGLASASVSYVGAAPGFAFSLVLGERGLGFLAVNDAAAVPEPGSLALLGAGLLVLLGMHRPRAVASTRR